MSEDDIVIAEPQLRAYAASIVRAAGSAAAEADKVAAQLVEANLRGHDSHGVGLLPDYVRNVKAGTLKPNQSAVLVKETDTLAVVDGRHGYGQVIGEQAMEFGIAKAKRSGMALVAIRRTHHLGRIGHWAEQCCAAGLVSIHFTSVASNASVAPWGGSDARLGTNPFTCGVPVEGDEPVILDMATSRLPVGKVRVAHNKKKKIIDGALIDSQGRPTNDPSVYFTAPRGTLLPFGEHKGYALGLIVELFAGALTGGGTISLGPDAPKGIINNMFSVIVDPVALGTARAFYDEVDAMVRFAKASPPAPGTEAVLVPGDPERRARRERLANGIPVDAGTWSVVGEAARSVGVEPPQPS